MYFYSVTNQKSSFLYAMPLVLFPSLQLNSKFGLNLDCTNDTTIEDVYNRLSVVNAIFEAEDALFKYHDSEVVIRNRMQAYWEDRISARCEATDSCSHLQRMNSLLRFRGQCLCA